MHIGVFSFPPAVLAVFAYMICSTRQVVFVYCYWVCLLLLLGVFCFVVVFGGAAAVIKLLFFSGFFLPCSNDDLHGPFICFPSKTSRYFFTAFVVANSFQQ